MDIPGYVQISLIRIELYSADNTKYVEKPKNTTRGDVNIFPTIPPFVGKAGKNIAQGGNSSKFGPLGP